MRVLLRALYMALRYFPKGHIGIFLPGKKNIFYCNLLLQSGGEMKVFCLMENSAYFPVLVQLLVAAVMGVVIIAASHIFGQRSKPNALKDSAYECGMKPFGAPHPRFGVKFYLIAALFVIFDIEIVFMIPFAFIYADFLAANLPVVLSILFFIALMAVGLIYEIKKNALDWGLPKSN